MNRSVALTAAAVAILGLAACDHEVRISRKDRPDRNAAFKTIDRLDCPEQQGDLKRVSAAADGKACAYAFQDQTEVELKLVTLTNDDATTLEPLETQLRGLVPPPPSGPTAALETNGDEDAHIRLPGLSIDAEGDRARIRVGGLHIDGQGDHANISVKGRNGGDVNIIANDGGAEIQQNRSSERGVRRTLILANETPTTAGYRLVGYEARGPKAGPLVVAVVRARGDTESDYVFRDMKALVRRNAGG